MIPEQAYIDSRRAVHAFIDEHKFNWCVISIVDSEKGELRDWYHFAHHPEDWTTKEIRYQAWRMSSATSDILKEEVSTDTRKINTSAKRALASGGPVLDDFLLGWFGIGWPDPEKRLYFAFRFSVSEILVGLRWWHGEELSSGKPYWAVQFMFGPLFLSISRRK